MPPKGKRNELQKSEVGKKRTPKGKSLEGNTEEKAGILDHVRKVTQRARVKRRSSKNSILSRPYIRDHNRNSEAHPRGF